MSGLWRSAENPLSKMVTSHVAESTAYAMLQLELWERDDNQWRKVFKRPPYQPRPQRAPETPVQQLALPMVGPTVGVTVALQIVVFG